jgi:hypothetical protein
MNVRDKNSQDNVNFHIDRLNNDYLNEENEVIEANEKNEEEKECKEDEHNLKDMMQ